MSEAGAGSRTAQPQVSIVVPTYNRAAFLARLLGALEDQTVPADSFDVIVVDDGSTDDTPSVLSKRYLFPLRSLAQENAGPAAARNAGIAVAAGEIVLFVDDDVIPARDLVERHVKAHEGREIVAFGRLCAPADGRKQPFWAEWELRTLDRQYAEMLEGKFRPTFRQFYTANASVRRADLLRAGLFNPTFRRTEDVELAYRLEDLPREIVFVPDAVVFHDTPRTMKAWLRMARQYGRYDVVLSRLPDHAWFGDYLRKEFLESRQRITRSLVRLTVGRPYAAAAASLTVPRVLQALDFVGLRRLSLAGCSLLFSLLYWDAFCREIGGREHVWRRMHNVAPPFSAAAVE